MPKIIGILGGMGPEATVLLMQRIIAFTPAQDDSDHIPLLIDNNTQVPSRIKALIEKDGEDPGPVLAAMAKRLAEQGAQALAMPCNTAHHYADEIQNASAVPLLNMVRLSVDAVLDLHQGTERIGILGSPAIERIELFDHAFAGQDIETLYPQDQKRMLGAIRAIKAHGNDPQARTVLAEAALELTGRGADLVLVACSEFSIVSDAVPSFVTYLDTIDVLARAVIDFATAEA